MTSSYRVTRLPSGTTWSPAHTRDPGELVVEVDDNLDSIEVALLWTSIARKVGINLDRTRSADVACPAYVVAMVQVDGCWYDIQARESLVSPGKLRIRAAEQEGISLHGESPRPWRSRARAA